MKPLLFAELLALVQTPPPVPHQATDSPANTPHNSRSQANQQPRGSNPLPPANVINSINNENSGDTVSSKDQPETVRITELPPVAVSRHWADWVLWGFNGLLVFAGFAGIWYARKTLKTIKEQTAVTRKTADAAKESAEAATTQIDVMKSQFSISHRPWVNISGAIKTDSPLVFDDTGAYISISDTLKNGGTAPALGTTQMNQGLIIGPMPRTPEETRQKIDCSKGGFSIISNVAGVLILPGDTVEFKNLKLNSQPRQAIPNVGPQEIWFTLCIQYKDESGDFHGTGLLWRFDPADEKPILPRGSVHGVFTQIGIGNESY
jgi:hypothetical protein